LHGNDAHTVTLIMTSDWTVVDWTVDWTILIDSISGDPRGDVLLISDKLSKQ